MDENVINNPPEGEPQKRNTGLIIAIVVVVVLCCCCLAGLAAFYFGYDLLGDPLGFYSALPIVEGLI